MNCLKCENKMVCDKRISDYWYCNNCGNDIIKVIWNEIEGYGD